MTVAWLSWFDTHVFVSTFSAPMSLLCAFEAAARHQSFTAAAAELHLTQSAVSRQIRALEDRLGAELFVRERQTVRLTAAGQAYAQEIRGSLMRIANATLSFRTNPQGGQLNLAILPTFGTRWLAPRLPQFFRSNRASPLISPRACRGLTFNWKPWMRPSTLVSRTGLVQSWRF